MQSSFRSRAFALVLLSACGNSPPPTVVDPDAPPDSPPDPPGNIIFVDTFGDSPVFIRYRTGGGEWQEPVDTGKGYELRVGDDYELVAVCTSGTGFDVGFEVGTVDETETTYLPCFTQLESARTIAVTGTMAQPGIVTMEDVATSGTPDWSFELAVVPGTHDLVAASDTHVAIRRDVDASNPFALPAIDAAAEGAPFVTRAFTTNAVADEVVNTQVLWFTTNSAAFLPSGPGSTAKLPPESLVDGNDFFLVELDAAGLGTFRMIYATETTPPDVEFLPVIDNVTFTADGVTWSGSLPYAGDLSTFQGASSVHLTASPGWIATHDKLAIDTDIPGFLPEWRIVPEQRGFSISDDSPTTFRYSTLVELK